MVFTSIGKKVMTMTTAAFDGQSKPNHITMIGAIPTIAPYLLPGLLGQLQARFAHELKPGTRIVSHDFTMGEWKPDQHDEIEAKDKYSGAGGRSDIVMWIVPARVAGVARLVMVVPSPAGQLNPLVLAAAQLGGVSEIYRVGGAQAVAALAYGTATIAPVAKIVGPGNAYVAAAKRLVFGKVGIDMIAGPSEVLILADRHANAEWIAADLLAQAEHDTAAVCAVLEKMAGVKRKTTQRPKRS